MDVHREMLELLDEVLGLDGRARDFTDDTPLLGSIPELDSMAVVSLITAIEERFDISIDDDEIEGDTFATVGSLCDLVATKLGSAAAG